MALWNKAIKKRVLETIAQGASLVDAAEASDISYWSIYKYMREDAEFAAKVEEARLAFVDRIENKYFHKLETAECKDYLAFLERRKAKDYAKQVKVIQEQKQIEITTEMQQTIETSKGLIEDNNEEPLAEQNRTKTRIGVRP